MEKFITSCDERERAYIIHGSLSQGYAQFYKWLYTVKLEHQYSDFPRDYIVLSEADEAIMLDKFEHYILRHQ